MISKSINDYELYLAMMYNYNVWFKAADICLFLISLFATCPRLGQVDFSISLLTHWGRVTHICVSNLTIIGSDNGLSPGRRQAII